MNSKNFTTVITVERTAGDAFDAIKNFKAWWSEDIEGSAHAIGDVFFYHYKDIHLCSVKLITELPHERLVYWIMENQFSFTKDKSEWTNTKLIFDLHQDEINTKIVFTHEGLTPDYECYDICVEAWTNYIQNSLHKLLTTGEGEPNPRDKEGFNAAIANKWRIRASIRQDMTSGQ
ncbi:MAG TPA: SRPBCC domain-containing protein [Saprospiraceae bacterium]|nr:SRPBCC domain-containing protein [Saprospiraceae bacterium]